MPSRSIHGESSVVHAVVCLDMRSNFILDLFIIVEGVHIVVEVQLCTSSVHALASLHLASFALHLAKLYSISLNLTVKHSILPNLHSISLDLTIVHSISSRRIYVRRWNALFSAQTPLFKYFPQIPFLSIISS